MYYFCDTTIHTSSFKIPEGGNDMDNKYVEQFIIMQSTIEANGQDYDEKIKNLIEDLKVMIK